MYLYKHFLSPSPIPFLLSNYSYAPLNLSQIHGIFSFSYCYYMYVFFYILSYT